MHNLRMKVDNSSVYFEHVKQKVNEKRPQFFAGLKRTKNIYMLTYNKISHATCRETLTKTN